MSDEMVLSLELSMKFDKIVDQLRQKLYPHCIILADITGQLLSYHISNKEFEAANLAALFASNLGATSAIADEIQEEDGFDSVMQEGKNYNIFLSKIGNSYLLAVIFSKKDQIGLVRLFTKKACEELFALTGEYEKQNPTLVSKKVGKDFSEKLDQVFDDIFKNL